MRATATYIVDVLALPAGNEKGKSEVKLLFTSLRNRRTFIISHFLSEGSIRYYNKVTVDEQVFKTSRHSRVASRLGWVV